MQSSNKSIVTRLKSEKIHSFLNSGRGAGVDQGNVHTGYWVWSGLITQGKALVCQLPEFSDSIGEEATAGDLS